MIELIQSSDFHFLRPWWLVLLAPLLWLQWRKQSSWRQSSVWRKSLSPHLLKALTVEGGNPSWSNPHRIGIVLSALCVISMAGPSWQRQSSPLVEDQTALLIALDLSSSMNQADIQPSRLERAKQKVSDLIKLRPDSRISLVAFSGSAHQVIPLSNDPDIIRQYLAVIESRMMPKAGKSPERILPLVDQVLGGADVPGTLLLITDGVGSDTLQQFDQYFNKAPYQLLVLGMGMIERGDTQLHDEQAHIPLQEDALQQLVNQSGGQYQPSTIDKNDILRLDRLIDKHTEKVNDSDTPWVDAGYYLLFPIGFICLLWFRQGWTLNACFALFFIQTFNGDQSAFAAENAQVESGSVVEQSINDNQRIFDSQHHEEPITEGHNLSSFQLLSEKFLKMWLSSDQLGRYYFEKGDYQRAASHFRDPHWQGMSFYYAENFAEAIKLFELLETPAGRFNYANALAQGEHYVKAVQTYSDLLQDFPDHQGALKNRLIVQQIVDDINRMSESQRDEPGKASRELGDLPQRGEGAEQLNSTPQLVEQLTAEQLLTDLQIHEMWMRQVQVDPSRFLAAKFQLQYNTMSSAAKSGLEQ